MTASWMICSPYNRRLRRRSLVDFTRVGGKVPISQTTGIGFRGNFVVGGLLPGRYAVVVRPALSSKGMVVSPAQAKIRIPQGEIEIGTGGRRGIELRKRK